MDRSPIAAEFDRDGIVFPLRAMAPGQASAMAHYLGGIEARFGGKIPSDVNHKIHLLSPRLYDLVCAPAITDRVAEILGPDVLCWGAGFFIKHAHDPAFVSWHQDATYWGLSSNDVVTAWVALTPSRVENGCLRVVRGSHHQQQLPHVETYAEENLLSRGQEIAVTVDPAAATDVVLEPGEMSFHHVLIVHGSEPNTADYPRIGFAIRYIPTGTRQMGGMRTSATLARGTDRLGHFDREERPTADFDAAAVESHRAALAAQQNGLFKGATSASASTMWGRSLCRAPPGDGAMAEEGEAPSNPPVHPEEMTADTEIRIGTFALIRVRARTTPAGLVCTAILVSSVLLSIGWMMRQRGMTRR